MFVGTVNRFGYRFVGDVTVDTPATRSALPRVKLFVVVAQREIVLMEGINVIGREPPTTIPIDGRGVSRHHARIHVSDGDAMLEDLGSKTAPRERTNDHDPGPLVRWR